MAPRVGTPCSGAVQTGIEETPINGPKKGSSFFRLGGH